jgi:SAM-dependent methyltransferase
MDVELPEAWHFYHTMDVPSPDGIVTHHGQWDLRGRYDDYLYGIDVKGKSVLDIGTASGWISFEVERRGAAEVVGLDRADDVHRQLVPYAFLDPEHTKVRDDDRAAALARFRSRNYPKAYWYCHRRYRSSAKVVYGDAHTAGDHISGADIVVLGQILVHQRDPLEVLHQAARIANESLVIVEGSFELEQPVMAFCGQGGNFYSWFHLSIGMYRLYLAILGFEITSVRRSAYRCNHVDLTGDIELWTIVAKRTAPTLGRPASIGDP